jgi:hypothetical protein
MKAPTALLSSLLLLPHSLVAQSTCRQAPATAVEHSQAFTVYTVPLPTRPRPFVAKAFVPNAGSPAGAFVFSLSTLVGSDPVIRVQMMPVAVELATRGRPTIVLQRGLTWPEVAKSVGHLQADVLVRRTMARCTCHCQARRLVIRRTDSRCTDSRAITCCGRQHQYDLLLGVPHRRS